MNLSDIIQKLEIIKKDKEALLSDSKNIVCGYNDIKFGMVLSENSINKYEYSKKIRLSDEYKEFITKIGNGGFGFGHGLIPFSLKENADPRISEDYNKINIGKPFPYCKEWNDEELLIMMEKDFDNEDEQKKKDELLEHYFSTDRIDGCICLCNVGCGDIFLLVVTGDNAGQVWYDARGNFGGLFPYYVQDKDKPATFFEWYGTWLDEIILKIPYWERMKVEKRSN